MIFVHNRASARNKISDDSADEATSGISRKRCRNPRCRSKLPTPVESPHRAFCTRGCYESFYRTRCRVCERDLRKTGKRGDENRRYCRPPNRCASEARKWPEKYGFGARPLLPPVQRKNNDSYIDSTGLKIGREADRPRHRTLRSWSWHSDDLEHELRDAAGTLLARIESNAGRHRLTHPRTWPILSWPDLAEAKHRAESVALSANPKLAARIKRDNETPHPMGPPLNRPPLTGDATSSDWRPTGNGAGVLNIPPFLQRAA